MTKKSFDCSNDMEFNDNEVLELYNCFWEILKAAGLVCTEFEVLFHIKTKT